MSGMVVCPRFILRFLEKMIFERIVNNMQKLEKGFYTALGTPTDENGNIIRESLEKELDMQIEAGASGLLLMGSMGIEAAIKDAAYVEAVKIASARVKGRTPLFVGAMDNSLARIKDRMEAIKEYDFTAYVLTTPFYSVSTETVLINFFKKAADMAPKPIFLYDLAVVTKQKITYSMIEELSKHKNIKGIKTGDIVLARQIKNNYPEFEVLFSNIDVFDVAVSYGIDKVLDGMFSATPVNGRGFREGVISKNISKCREHLDNIVGLRDVYIKHGVLEAFTASMNALGMDGIFYEDYHMPVSKIGKEEVIDFMKKIGEIV